MLVRHGDTMTATEVTSAIVEYDAILNATAVVADEIHSDTPWDDCDGYDHTWTPLRDLDFDVSGARGECFTGCERGVIQLAEDGQDYQDSYVYFREKGASRQVAAEMIALIRRRTLDQLVQWYTHGWTYYGVRCEYKILGKIYQASVWGIDDQEYAEREVVSEIADEVAADLEKDGFTINNRPKHGPFPSRADKLTRLRHNAQQQSWR